MMQLSDLNQLPQEEFLKVIGGPLEGETWLAERLVQKRPFADVDALMDAFREVVGACNTDEKIALIASHPDLAIKKQTHLSAASQQEQAAAGLNQLTEAEYELFKQLNTDYRETFGFPFVICARENTKTSILAAFQTRLHNERDDEIATGLAEIIKIVYLRILDTLTTGE